MFLLLSWKGGEPPFLEFIPASDPVGMLRVILKAALAGREVRIYFADASAAPPLNLVYPDAEAVSVEAGLVSK